MPFRSGRQRRYMWAKHPDIARKWTSEHGSKIVPGNDKKKKKKDFKDAAARRSMNHKKKKNKSSKMTGMGGY